MLFHFHALYNMAPNTVDLTEWVVVSQDDEKKKGRAKKVPMVKKPKITLKVAKAVDNESASFSEASLGHSQLGVETGGGCKLCGIWVFYKS